MSFSRAQQPGFRDMLNAAWAVVCREWPAAMRCKGKRCGECHFCAWYEGELLEATGHSSTTECNAGRDYDFAMAHFEAIAGAGIIWQMRVHTGDAKRILFQLGEVKADHGLDEAYLRACAKRALKAATAPELSTLSKPQLVLILGEVKRSLRRAVKREEATGAIDIPF